MNAAHFGERDPANLCAFAISFGLATGICRSGDAA